MSAVSAAMRALAYDAARWPVLLGMLSRIPVLGIGETVYDPGFAQGAIAGSASSLAWALLPELAPSARERAEVAIELADAIRHETPYRPLVAAPGDTAVHPRLAVVSPSAEARRAALLALKPLGASPLYPSSLARIQALRPHLADDPDCPGADELAARLFTLPTHIAVRTHIGAIADRLR